MTPETYERALHMWPDWQDSITKSREELGYDPSWSVEMAVKWIIDNYSMRVKPLGESELKRLILPPNLQQYWEDCLYCDYIRPDGSADPGKIRRHIAYEENGPNGEPTGRWIRGEKSLPKLPIESAITYYEGEDIHSPWQRIEIRVFSPLATRDLLETAVERAWDDLSYALESSKHPFDGYIFPPLLGGVNQWNHHIPWAHPLSELIPKAKSNISDVKRYAIERYQRDEIDFEGLMLEVWNSPEIQAGLREIASRYRENPSALEKSLRDTQKKVYNRVRGWLPDPKPKVKERGRLQESLTVPEFEGHQG